MAAISRNCGADRPRAADPFDLAFLDRAQQLGLQVRLEVADLVEEQRAAVGQLELADALLDRAGERALFVAEQRALDQLARNRRDVDGDERRLGVRRLAMQQAGEQFLAGAAFAEDQHRRGELRDLVHRFEHVLQRGARTGDEVAAAGIAGRVLQRQDVAMQVLPLAGMTHQPAHHVGIGVLGEEVIGAELDGLDRAVDVGRRRGHDDFDERKVLANDLQQVEAAEAGLLHVGDEHVHVLAVHQGQPGLCGRGANDAVIAAQGLGEALAGLVVSIDYQHRLAAGRHSAAVYVQ